MRSYMENHVGPWNGEQPATQYLSPTEILFFLGALCLGLETLLQEDRHLRDLLDGGSDDVMTYRLSREPMDHLWDGDDHVFGDVIIDSDDVIMTGEVEYIGSTKLPDIPLALGSGPAWLAHGDYGWRERSQQHLRSYRNRSHGNRPLGIMHRRKG